MTALARTLEQARQALEQSRAQDRAFVASRVPELLTDKDRDRLRRIQRRTQDPHVAARCDALLNPQE